MAIHAPSETLKALGGNHLPNCESRSLYKDRFADPMAKDDKERTPRKDWFTRLIGKNAARVSRSSWLPAHADPLHARLMSRLMVDLAGGVMENANINLDRYGLPRIPGSAVKGCARRMALQALHDWIAAGTERPAPDDACAPCCEHFATPAEMLAAIARVFGWTPEDWSTAKKDDLYKSDFAWACGGNADILQTAKSSNPPNDTFAGTIAFLEAAPHTDPDLELDVVTPHHTEYHKGNPTYATAPDTEDPIPVFFPAVKAQTTGNHFTFPILPLRRAASDDLAHAKRWLAHGLEIFGIGAKTHSGYGLFQVLTESQPAFPGRFDPVLSPVETFLKAWGSKQINSMSVRPFSRMVAEFQAADLTCIFERIAPGKISDLNDPFWNPFKTDSVAKSILETLRNPISPA